MSGGFAGFALLMFVAGMGIPVMAALNSGLGRSLGDPVAATACLFTVGVALAWIALAASGGPPPLARLAGAPPTFYGAAAFMVFYALSITFAAPRIGIGNAVFFVLLGQLVAAAAIDNWGLLGAMRFAMTGRRAIGMAVMAVGVYLARRGG